MSPNAASSAPQSGEATAQAQKATLRVDGQVYIFEELSDRARLLSVDFVRTEQEWQMLQHRLRQFVAMEAAMVNTLKQEVESSNMEPVWTSGEGSTSRDKPLLTIDSKSYDASTIPDNVRLHVDDLVRNNQERSQLEFRLRQLDAARLGYLSVIREELRCSGAQPVESESTAGQNGGQG